MSATSEQIEASRAFMQVANRLPTFYDLGAEFSALIALLEDEDADQNVIQLELEQLAGDIKRKAFGVAVVIQALEHLAELQASESKRLGAKAKVNATNADRVRAYALSVMQNTPGCERIETGHFTLALRQNPPSVTVLDPAAVPHEFERTKIVVEVDKRAILEHVKATGEVVDGVSIARTWRLDLK